MGSDGTPVDPQLAHDRDWARARLEEARCICAAEPDASFDDVRHTPFLLDLPPIERLNRGLLRGRATLVQR